MFVARDGGGVCVLLLLKSVMGKRFLFAVCVGERLIVQLRVYSKTDTTDYEFMKQIVSM